MSTDKAASISQAVANGDPRILLPLPIVLGIFLAFSVLGGGLFWADSNLQRWVAREAMAYIPSARCIADSSPIPARFAFVYGVQWLAAIPYLYYWFVVFPPWSRDIRRAARIKASSFGTRQRIANFVSTLLLALYMLGNFGVTGAPTFFNGKFACAGELSPAILSSIHSHWQSLAIYGAVAVLCECTLAWMLVFFVVNFRVYVFGDELVD